MGEQVWVVFAERNQEVIAAAFFLVGTDTLYGRYWGCFEEVPNLHFEACYYQGLDFCLAHGLRRFEPGAQGEHKIPRGFLPTDTWSMHWIAHPQFSQSIGQYLQRETVQIQQYMEELREHSPFKA
jgi:predicted N-acyltransferase